LIEFEKLNLVSRTTARIFDSTVFVQESRKGRPERGWNAEHPLVILATPPLVILSAAKDLTRRAEILRCAQDDSRWPIRLSSPDELMAQNVGINAARIFPYDIRTRLPICIS